MQPADPPEVAFPGVAVRSIVTHDAQVFVGLVGPATSKLFCPNPQQEFDIQTRVEHMVVRLPPELLAERSRLFWAARLSSAYICY